MLHEELSQNLYPHQFQQDQEQGAASGLEQTTLSVEAGEWMGLEQPCWKSAMISTKGREI